MAVGNLAEIDTIIVLLAAVTKCCLNLPITVKFDPPPLREQHGAEGRNADGQWSWAGEPVAVSGPVPESIPTEPITPPPPEDLEAITNVTPANNTIEVKREHLESAGDTLRDQVKAVFFFCPDSFSRGHFKQAEHNTATNPSPPPTLSINETAAEDSSTPSQLAGTKRPRDDADSSNVSTPRKRLPVGVVF